MKLSDSKEMLQSLIDGLSQSLLVDVAVFDFDSHLVACTDAYLKRKGSAVHAPSIEEAMLNNTILVNQPGFMRSCEGCRFREHCPATIEILSSIRIDRRPIGVIAITSFTKEGHDRITDNLHTYTKILNDISHLIGEISNYRNRIDHARQVEKILESTIEAFDDSLIIADSKGIITYANAPAVQLFSYCSLFSLSIDQIFPDSIVGSILSGERLDGELCQIGDFYGKVTAQPVIMDEHYGGSWIRIAKNQALTAKLLRQREIDYKDRFSLEQIKGSHTSILELKDKIKKVSRSASTVLITGETGTGKSLVAKAIHYESPRSDGPFIAINCASIPESLFESELFGYEEGAFTGAKKGGKFGMFELAQQGTLFLDEVGEMPPYIQAKLLKVLQDHTIERVGGTRSIAVDVRIIAATNKDIHEMIREKSFRKDLYYRLNVIPLEVPSLFHRIDDISALAEEFLRSHGERQKTDAKTLAPEVLSCFQSYPWPGNIRELENILEYAVNLEDSPVIHLSSLPESFTNHDYLTMPGHTTRPSTTGSTESRAILSALKQYGWDVNGKKAAARSLGISLRTLYRKLHELGIVASSSH
jgi:transcriptional regulator with PAS, ATPase and Fis domain